MSSGDGVALPTMMAPPGPEANLLERLRYIERGHQPHGHEDAYIWDEDNIETGEDTLGHAPAIGAEAPARRVRVRTKAPDRAAPGPPAVGSGGR